METLAFHDLTEQRLELVTCHQLAGPTLKAWIVISRELLVGALPIEHDLDVVCLGLPEDAPLSKDARRWIRFILVPGDPVGEFEDLLRLRINAMMTCAGC